MYIYTAHRSARERSWCLSSTKIHTQRDKIMQQENQLHTKNNITHDSDHKQCS